MITLHQFPPVWGLPNPSPFCVKVEAWLRLAGLPYQVAVERDPRKAPKGKLPYIDDDGRIVPDSGFIIADLEARYGTKVDDGVDELSLARAHAFRRLIEESLYFTVVYSRWADPACWPTTRAALFGGLTGPLAMLVPMLVRNSVLRSLRGQGIGLHRQEEVYALGCADLDAAAVALGPQPFFLGDQPRSIDACLWGTLIQILWTPTESPLKVKLESLPTLVAYCARMRDAVFPECQAGR